MKLKSIVLYEDTNVESYFEGDVLCYEDDFIEGIIFGGQDMYIYGRQNLDDIRLILMTPFNYPYTSECYIGSFNKKQNNYDVSAFDSEGNYDRMCSIAYYLKKYLRK